MSISRQSLYQASSLPVFVTASGRYVLTQKFIDGAKAIADAWDGTVTFFMESARQPTANLDNIEVEPDELPFEIRATQFDSARLRELITRGDIVVLTPSHKLHDIPALLFRHRVPFVYCTEYSLETRIQILRSDEIPVHRKLRRTLWEMNQERLIRRSIRRFASGVECNGTPTFEAYRDLCRESLLYFDTRMTRAQLIPVEMVRDRTTTRAVGNRLQLAYSGRVTAMKGTKYLVPMADELRRMGVPFDLHIFGDGDELPLLRKQVRRLNLGECVHLHGPVDFSRVLIGRLQREIDLFVCCHVQGDPSCTYLETFACGLPIVGFDNEAFRGLLDVVDAGWKVPIRDVRGMARRIGALARDRSEIRAKGIRARDFAADKTFEDTFDKRLEFYCRVLARSR